jgi:hypothetical protein
MQMMHIVSLKAFLCLPISALTEVAASFLAVFAVSLFLVLRTYRSYCLENEDQQVGVRTDPNCWDDSFKVFSTCCSDCFSCVTFI